MEKIAQLAHVNEPCLAGTKGGGGATVGVEGAHPARRRVTSSASVRVAAPTPLSTRGGERQLLRLYLAIGHDVVRGVGRERGPAGLGRVERPVGAAVLASWRAARDVIPTAGQPGERGKRG